MLVIALVNVLNPGLVRRVAVHTVGLGAVGPHFLHTLNYVYGIDGRLLGLVGAN